MNLIVEMGIWNKRCIYYSCSQQTLEYSELKRIKVVELYEVMYWKLSVQFQFTNKIYKND